MNSLFVCGSGRSGTTIITDIIGTHAELSPIYETEFAANICLSSVDPNWFHNLKDVVERWSKNKLGGVLMNESDKFKHGKRYVLLDDDFVMAETEKTYNKILSGVTESYAYNELITTLFNEHAKKDNKPYWISKTPSYTLCLPRLLQIFPNMKVINCIRDGRDVLCSFQKFNNQMNFSDEMTQWWIEKINAVKKFSGYYPLQCLNVKYEDFIADPEKTLNSIFEYIGVEQTASSVLDFYGRDNIKDSSIGVYKTIMTSEQISQFNLIAGQILGEFQYNL